MRVVYFTQKPNKRYLCTNTIFNPFQVLHNMHSMLRVLVKH